MRLSVGGLLLISSLLGSGALLAQTPAPTKTATVPAPPPKAAAEAAPAPKCENPNAMGVSRTVEIDTTGAPGFGFEHFKNHDFLKNGEVVLTFDDGPWPGNTHMVLKALADECLKATFFPIGKHATWSPQILKDVAAAGHSIGSHTWSHKNLEKMPFDQAKEEIEKGLSAVQWALDGAETPPFFRFPQLKHPPEVVKKNVDPKN
jgi:peptidoglycan/xylan/chitin deacetylase (PgdA/CDA1 family)